MKHPLEILNNIRIASPCTEHWYRMTGNEQRPVLLLVQQMVRDLSSMTAAEGAALISKRDGGLCVRLNLRADGTLVTKDDFRVRSGRLRKLVRRILLAMGPLLGLGLVVGCVVQRRTMGVCQQFSGDTTGTGTTTPELAPMPHEIEEAKETDPSLFLRRARRKP